MRFQLLGPLTATDGNGPIAIGGPKQRLVLAHLLLNVNKTVPADQLIDAMWGQETPETARGTLQTYISRLRSVLGPDAIEGAAPGYRFRAEPEELDTFRFESLLIEPSIAGLAEECGTAVVVGTVDFPFAPRKVCAHLRADQPG